VIAAAQAPPPDLALVAPATAPALPPTVRLTCFQPCVAEVRVVARPSPVLRVAVPTAGAAVLATGRRGLRAGVPVRLSLRPTALARRLGLTGARAPGRLHADIRVVVREPLRTLTPTRPLTLGPDRPWPVTIGRSVRGRPLTALLPPRGDGPLVVAAIHGTEPVTARLARAALRGVGAERLRAAVVVVANPDGLAAGTRHNARDVDLNRNFPSSDWGRAPVVAPGPRPASEPETRALMGLVRRLAPPALVTVHSPLAMVEDPRRGPLARFLAARTGLPLRPSVGYPTPGAMGRWTGELGVPDVTLELPPGPLRGRDVAALRAVLTGAAPGG
jgi:murein peptide amidase A